jgi:hypothetical protein
MKARGRSIAIVIATTLGVAVCVPSASSAVLLGDWNGEIKGDDNSFLTFNVEKNDAGKKRVVDVLFGGLDIICEGGVKDEADGVALLGGFRVRHGEFGREANAVISGFDPPAKLKGEFKPGKRSVGTIRLRGELDPNDHPGLNCRTGVQEWKAKKGPPPPV